MTREEYQSMRRARSAATVEDVEHLLENDPSLTQRQMAERLGLTQGAMAKRLERSGRTDLLKRMALNSRFNSRHRGLA